MPIVIAMTTVFGLVFLLGVIVFLHRRHVDNRRRKPKPTAATELPRAPTMTSSFTCHSVDNNKHDPHQYAAFQSTQGIAPLQKYLLDNSYPPNKNYVYDSRSDSSSMLKVPMIQQQQQQLMHAVGSGQQQPHHHLQINHPSQHLRYPLM